MGLRRRLEGLEGQIGARASPAGRPPWRTPEEEAARDEAFRKLYADLGWGEPPEPKTGESGEEAFEELFTMIEDYRYRAETDRKEHR